MELERFKKLAFRARQVLSSMDLGHSAEARQLQYDLCAAVKPTAADEAKIRFVVAEHFDGMIDAVQRAHGMEIAQGASAHQFFQGQDKRWEQLQAEVTKILVAFVHFDDVWGIKDDG